MTSYRVVDRSGGRSLLDRISGKQKQKSVREVAEEVRAAALQVGDEVLLIICVSIPRRFAATRAGLCLASLAW